MQVVTRKSRKTQPTEPSNDTVGQQAAKEKKNDSQKEKKEGGGKKGKGKRTDDHQGSLVSWDRSNE